MFRIRNLVIYVTVDVVSKETHRLHEREQGRRIRERGAELAAAVRREAEALREAEQASLPDAKHTELLRRHVERLESVMQNCSSQAWSVTNSAALDMEAWRKEQSRALDGWQERTILRIMDAANKHADALGFPAMFKPKNWKRFDEEEVPRIARDCLEELLEDYRDYLRVHNLPLWDKDDQRIVQIRQLARVKNKSYATYKTYLPPNNAELFCNTMISLIHQANYLLDRQLKSLADSFAEKGGLRERMYNARVNNRNTKQEKVLALLREIYRDVAATGNENLLNKIEEAANLLKGGKQ